MVAIVSTTTEINMFFIHLPVLVTRAHSIRQKRVEKRNASAVQIARIKTFEMGSAEELTHPLLRTHLLTDTEKLVLGWLRSSTMVTICQTMSEWWHNQGVQK